MNPFTDIRVGEITQMDIDNFIDADIDFDLECRGDFGTSVIPVQEELFEEEI